MERIQLLPFHPSGIEDRSQQSNVRQAGAPQDETLPPWVVSSRHMKKIDSACCKQGLLEIKDACTGAVKEAYGSDRLLILDDLYAETQQLEAVDKNKLDDLEEMKKNHSAKDVCGD